VPRIKELFVTLIIVIIASGLYAQEDLFFSSSPAPIAPYSKQCLYFSFDNLNFLKNNEYFNPVDEGITYIGSSFNPHFDLLLNNRLSVSAGWFGILYSGRSKISNSIPYYNVTWNLYNGWKLRMGHIDGFNAHRLPEPIFSADRRYENSPETGLQVTADRKHHSSDIWLNWEKFILPGDNFKEEFVMGGRSFIFINPSGSRKNVALSLNGIAAHKGGQVGSAGEHLSTLMNSAVGIIAFIKPNESTDDSIGIRNDFCGYRDASPFKQQLYSAGWGNYSTIFGKYHGFYFEAGYWYGRHFIAPRGQWLFQSVSKLYTVYWEPVNNIVTTKVGWTYKPDKQFKAGIGGGLYYDTELKNIDFYYQFHLSLNLSYLIKEF